MADMYPPGAYEIADELKIPVTCLTGFLGAGKTTLLNHILKTNHGYKYAVVENEFGEIGIDTDLVQSRQNIAEEIVSMDNGCVCCTVREDLVKGIRKLLAMGKQFDGIIIETTGMADPGPVVQTFYQNPDLRRRCRVDGVITVVDSKHCQQHLFDANREEGAVNESLQQVAVADRILLNKTDLVDKDQLEDLKADITKINPMADMIECQEGKVDPGKLIGINKFSLEKMLDSDPMWDKAIEGANGHNHSHGHGHGHGHEKHIHDENCGHDKGDCNIEPDNAHDHDHGHAVEKAKKNRHDTAVTSVGVRLGPGKELSWKHLQEWLRELIAKKGEELYRYKGILAVKGMEEKFVFQGVHMVFDGDYLGTWDIEPELRESKFVFIGKNLDREQLTKEFEACIAPTLRFKVGDQVMAKVGGGTWKQGTIIKTWDRGDMIIHPYRIQLNDVLNDKGEKVEVHGPKDIDAVVRAAQASI